MSDRRGFSLVELVVVLAIFGTLLAIVSLNFSQMSKKAQVEALARELLIDFNTARLDSIYRKNRHSIVMNTDGSGYVMKRYSSADEANSAGTSILTKNSSYPLTKANGSNFVVGDRTFMFDTRGFTSDLNTIKVNFANSGAAFDCIVVSAGRTNIGQMSGGSCVEK